jgi:hypothetical protein
MQQLADITPKATVVIPPMDSASVFMAAIRHTSLITDIIRLTVMDRIMDTIAGPIMGAIPDIIADRIMAVTMDITEGGITVVVMATTADRIGTIDLILIDPITVTRGFRNLIHQGTVARA